MKILVVDDEPNVVTTLTDFLDDCGHTTVSATDGLNGFEMMSRHADVGLVIADIRMPRMDGIEFLKTLKVRYPGVPAILVTGHGDEGLAVAALQEGRGNGLHKETNQAAGTAGVGRWSGRTPRTRGHDSEWARARTRTPGNISR